MRLPLLVAATSLIGGGAFAQSMLGQSDPGGGRASSSVVVPPPPAIVAAPEAPAAPVSARPLAPPAGLVETPLPPPKAVYQPVAVGSSQPSPPLSQSPAPTPVKPVPTLAMSPSAPSGAAASDTDATLAKPASNAPGATVPVALPANDVAPTPDNKWVFGHTAELGVLNKVDGSTQMLTVPVGGQATAGDLTVSVQACVVRPEGSLPNTAIFLTLQPKAANSTDSQIYRGWIVKSLPGSSAAENADEVFRVVSCS